MAIPQISTQLSPSPKAFPTCCLSISSTLTSRLASLLPPKPSFTVSIGSGSGLLEALISHRHPDISVEGVEVKSAVNRYISEPDMHVVNGTWDLHPRVGEAQAWMFVYPRQPKLVSKYLERFGNGAVYVIVWLGPKVDWVDYESCFRGSVFEEVEIPDNSGVAEFEMLVILRKKGQLE